MKIVIVGCGRVGSRLAMRLFRAGHDITVVDDARDAFNRLDPDFAGATFHGSGLELDVLRRSGAGEAAIVFALTGGDNRNLMIAQMVKHQLRVERAVARLHDPVRSWKYRELGIETLCTTTVLEGLLEIYVERGEFPELPGEMSVNGDASALEN